MSNHETENKDNQHADDVRTEEGVTPQDGRSEETPGEQRSEGGDQGAEEAADAANEAAEGQETHTETTHTEETRTEETSAPAAPSNGGIA